MFQIDVEMKTPTEKVLYRNLKSAKMLKDMYETEGLGEKILSPVGYKQQPASCHISPDRIKMLKGKVVEVLTW